MSNVDLVYITKLTMKSTDLFFFDLFSIMLTFSSMQADTIWESRPSDMTQKSHKIEKESWATNADT